MAGARPKHGTFFGADAQQGENKGGHGSYCFGSEPEHLEGARAWRLCKKNKELDHHKNFIPILELSEKHLADDCPHKEEMLACIKAAGNVTVKVLVKYVSLARPDNDPLTKLRGQEFIHNGTGWVGKIEEEESARTEQATKSWTIEILTANHVVFDNSEVRATEAIFFYDDKNGTPRMVHGSKMTMNNVDFDMCAFRCVTQDEQLVSSLMASLNEIKRTLELWEPSTVVVISHPHGQPKKVTVGKRDDLVAINMEYSADTCPGSSGAPVLATGMQVSRFGFYPGGGPHSIGGTNGGRNRSAPGGFSMLFLNFDIISKALKAQQESGILPKLLGHLTSSEKFAELARQVEPPSLENGPESPEALLSPDSCSEFFQDIMSREDQSRMMREMTSLGGFPKLVKEMKTDHIPKVKKEMASSDTVGERLEALTNMASGLFPTAMKALKFPDGAQEGFQELFATGLMGKAMDVMATDFIPNLKETMESTGWIKKMEEFGKSSGLSDATSSGASSPDATSSGRSSSDATSSGRSSSYATSSGEVKSGAKGRPPNNKRKTYVDIDLD